LEQIATLNNRGDKPPPPSQRLSGAFQVPRVPVGSRNGLGSPKRAVAPHLPHITTNGTFQYPSNSDPPPSPDQPLIISTPKGVSGAFDPPDRQTSGRRVETPLLAPVPRHPQPTRGEGPVRPTAERLETIYSTVSSNGPAGPAQDGGQPSWFSGPSSSPHTRQQSVKRNRSRAGRSAAKNMRDAKMRGWSGGNRKKKRQMDGDVASTANWTEVSVASQSKGRRCILM
jgi:hypothetical protein